jgi:beta-glucosidase
MRKSRLKCALLSLSVALLCQPMVFAGDAPVPDSPAIEQRVDSLLAKLSLQQKLQLIGGVDNFYTYAQPNIGLPQLKMSDGPFGVRVFGKSTAYAAGIGLAASWDPSLAERVGEAMGRDARARGVHVILGPGVNMYRSPLNGRNMEYFGEDPLLSGSIAVGLIDGIQSQGVMATVKHFAANNSEYDRRHIDSIVDERTLHEIYLPAFEMAVKQGHVGAVMSSYNLLNHDYTSESRALLTDILKKQWRFDGLVMSDWGAVHDGEKAFKAGVDLEMPNAEQMNAALIAAKLKDGTLRQVELDDKVRRILRTVVRFGFLDRDQTLSSLPLDSAENDQIALQNALECLTLLKNEHHVLPLDAGEIKTVAVIGPAADPAIASAGGSSHVDTFHAQSILNGIKQLLGDKVKVLYTRGLPTPMDVFRQSRFTGPDGEAGLRKTVFANDAFTGKPVTSTDVHVDQWKSELWTTPAKQHKSIRWSGHFTPTHDGQYLFLTAAASEDTYTLYVDGKPVIEQPHREGQAPHQITLALHANQPVTIRLDYKPDVDDSRMGFGVIAVDDMISPDARNMAKQADAAIVAVGFDPATESEAFDRTYELPWGQNALIEAVAAANPKTVVTVTSGGGYATRPWLDKVPALLQNWYPGQEGGTAIAHVLFGLHSPEGKLPISFEREWADNPTHDSYAPTTITFGKVNDVAYREGVFLGYRWYTSHPDRSQPLFAFGYGLSYSTFAFAHLQVGAPDANDNITVSFDVINTGQREAADVAQLYVGDPSAKVARPARELKAFRKVRLTAGQTQHVTLTLDRRSFAYYDVASHDWKVNPGAFKVYVGDASDNTPLTADLSLQR